MSLQCFPGLHHLVLGEGFLLTPGDAGDCKQIYQHTIAFTAPGELWQCGGALEQVGYSRVPSANSSFLRFILSFRFSASRRACWMRACIWSGETSFDMLA